MFRKLLAALSVAVAASAAMAAPPYSPYSNEGVDEIYNLLFADDRAAFEERKGASPTSWQAALGADPADIPTLERLAADESQEGRIRYLAYSRLRELGRPVPAKTLLGVVVEVHLDEGLDTLAAYSDGGVRYINRSGKMVVIDRAAAVASRVSRLFDASAPVVARLKPWDGPRRAPPRRGSARLSFLASDGLYFGEGPMQALQRDAMAGPVIEQATQLLLAVVAAGTK